MVYHDVVGTVIQEQIVQYISPVHTTHQTSTYNQWDGGVGGGGNALPLTKVLGHLPPWPICSYTTMYTTHSPVTCVKNTSVTWSPLDMTM